MKSFFQPCYGASGSGLAALVLAQSLYLKVKTKLHFTNKQVINESASVVFGLVRFIVLSYNS